MNKDDFEKFKSMTLECTGQQKDELRRLLTAEQQNRGAPGSYSDATDTLYTAIKFAFASRTHTALPTLRDLQKHQRWMADSIKTSAQAVERFMDNEFNGCKHVERDAVRALLVDAAISTVMERQATPSPSAVLATLLVPEQVVDNAFPGYRERGVLKEMFLRHIHRAIRK